MLMFLTRMGQGSKMVVTGDITQIDLPDPTESGLIDAARKLNRTKGVGFVHFEKTDVVRHDLVQRVIEAYGEESVNESLSGKPRGRRKTTDNTGTQTP
jgi:phosphate starvation-inducible PhoH-like protein